MAEPEKNESHGKKFDLKKHKWWIFGGGGVLVLLFLAMHRQSSSSGSTAQTTAQNNGIDPATGYLYGSAADLAALNGNSEGTYSSGAGTDGTTGSTTNNYYYYSGSGTSTGGTTSGGSGGSGGSSSGGSVHLHGGNPPRGGGGAVAAAGNSQYYTVKSGDSLWSIATKFYGSGKYDSTIYNANKGIIGSNMNLIHPGQRLVIPSKK